jgi:hypothetical protein
MATVKVPEQKVSYYTSKVAFKTRGAIHQFLRIILNSDSKRDS